ncbi:MAG: hypothetical protein PVS2B1_10640 [Candidatus Dormibacteraceae bacterium]
MSALISPDGRWWWDGHQWRSRIVEGPLDLLWFTTTADWFGRVLVTGLIGLIPIVGAINLLGWTLAATDMVRNGWKELPPAGFQHLERGVSPFVVSLVYGLVLFTSLILLASTTVLVAISGRAQAILAIVPGVLTFVLAVAWWVISLYLFASLMIGSDRLGIAKALNPRRLFGLARANHDVSLRVGLIYAVMSIAIAVVAVPVALVIPFGGLFVGLVLPAVYAILVPRLTAFQIEPQERPGLP